MNPLRFRSVETAAKASPRSILVRQSSYVARGAADQRPFQMPYRARLFPPPPTSAATTTTLGGGDTERRSSRALEERSERDDDTGREDGGGVEGEGEGEGESKGDDGPSG